MHIIESESLKPQRFSGMGIRVYSDVFCAGQYHPSNVFKHAVNSERIIFDNDP
jgi:hypothetical protein